MCARCCVCVRVYVVLACEAGAKANSVLLRCGKQGRRLPPSSRRLACVTIWLISIAASAGDSHPELAITSTAAWRRDWGVGWGWGWGVARGERCGLCDPSGGHAVPLAQSWLGGFGRELKHHSSTHPIHPPIHLPLNPSHPPTCSSLTASATTVRWSAAMSPVRGTRLKWACEGGRKGADGPKRRACRAASGRGTLPQAPTTAQRQTRAHTRNTHARAHAPGSTCSSALALVWGSVYFGLSTATGACASSRSTVASSPGRTGSESNSLAALMISNRPWGGGGEVCGRMRAGRRPWSRKLGSRRRETLQASSGQGWSWTRQPSQATAVCHAVPALTMVLTHTSNHPQAHDMFDEVLISPHLDDGTKTMHWRNMLWFDPLVKDK